MPKYTSGRYFHSCRYFFPCSFKWIKTNIHTLTYTQRHIVHKYTHTYKHTHSHTFTNIDTHFYTMNILFVFFENPRIIFQICANISSVYSNFVHIAESIKCRAASCSVVWGKALVWPNQARPFPPPICRSDMGKFLSTECPVLLSCGFTQLICVNIRWTGKICGKRWNDDDSFSGGKWRKSNA